MGKELKRRKEVRGRTAQQVRAAAEIVAAHELGRQQTGKFGGLGFPQPASRQPDRKWLETAYPYIVILLIL